MIKFIPANWRIPFIVMTGSTLGLVLFLVYISNFFSYLSDEPSTCMNCHIMGTQYSTWAHSSHREGASCNDCHVPQDHFLKKWFFKGNDGMRHSAIFTIRGEEQAIIIKEEGKWAVQKNCIRCHKDSFSRMVKMQKNILMENEGRGRVCWECHTNVPHGKVRSLSSTPYARVPTTESMVPKWLSKKIKEEKNKKK